MNYKVPNQYPQPNDPHEPWRTKPSSKEEWKTPAPKPITIADLFPRLDRLSIGWSPILEQLKQVTDEKPSYPPYDLIQVGDDQNILDVAVAGFSKKEITITVQEAVLTIKGEKTTERAGEVLYKGIAARDFELKLAMAEYWDVISASINDGLLSITMGKKLPEEKKPKVIDIK